MNLTFIIPVFNTESYIQRCFNSLITENLKYIFEYSIKVLFINDGSTDGSQIIIKDLVAKYDFVKSIDQENQGLSMARNTGVRNVDTEYFSFLDSDDWLDMKVYQVILKQLYSKSLDFISYGLCYFNEQEEFTSCREKQLVIHNKTLDGITFLKQDFQPSSACLYVLNTNFFLRNDLFFIPNIMQEDVEFTFRLMMFSKNGYFVDLKPYCYFRHTESMTMTSNIKRLKTYLLDSISVAQEIAKHKRDINEPNIIFLIEKNYNSVVWNLLWRFVSNPKEVDYAFKIHCLHEMKKRGLYPIQGSLKTPFQKVSTLLFNQEFFLKQLFKFR